MYLFIFEDQTMRRYETISDNDLEMADDGYCDILDVSEAGNPLKYFNGAWDPIELQRRK